MCGQVLIDTYGKGKATKSAFRRYQSQSKRGTLGFGCVSINQKKINKVYRSVDEAGIRQVLGDKSDMVLFHHRHPTSTPNVEEATHPIFVSNVKLEYDYYITHNGIISNASDLKQEFEKLGFVFTTEMEEFYKIKQKYHASHKTKFNDSESFAIDIAIAIEEGKKDIKSRGSIAFIALQVNKETQIVETVFFGRNKNNPLKMQRLGQSFVLASEGDGVDVETDKLYSYSPTDHTVAITDLCIGTVYTPPFNFEKSYNKTAEQPSVLPPYGRQQWLDSLNKRHHHATHDIIRAQKSNVDLVSGCVSLKNDRSQKVTIEFDIKDGLLNYTTVEQDDLQYIHYSQWEWYIRLCKERDGILDSLKRFHKEGFPVLHMNNVVSIKANSKQFKTFSDVIIRMANVKRVEILQEEVKEK